MILFLSKYPYTEEQFRDGFFQRVVDIDTYFENDERIYLDVSLRKNMRKKARETQNSMKKVYTCNIFLHFFFIIKLFSNANFVYIHSLHNTLYSFLFIKWIKNKYVLDLHGVVPEELEFQGMTFKAKAFNWIEKLIYSKLYVTVAVTNRLAIHYKSKYPNAKAKYIVYAILPNNIETSSETDLNIKSNKLNVIYSGNTQAWQNIDLMLKTIVENQSNHIEYTILTGELDRMNELLTEYKLRGNSNINVQSVQPSELSAFYEKANYGFILRDDITVNNVACPTKLIEYLNYGIIPIVLSDKIGDFKELGYEYISVKDFNLNLPKIKSEVNQKLVKNLKISNDINLKIKINDLLYY